MDENKEMVQRKVILKEVNIIDYARAQELDFVEIVKVIDDYKITQRVEKLDDE